MRRVEIKFSAGDGETPVQVSRAGYDAGLQTYGVARFVSSDGTVSLRRWDTVHRPTGCTLGRWFCTRAEAVAFVRDLASWVGDDILEADMESAMAKLSNRCPLLPILVRAWPEGICIRDAVPEVTLARNEEFAIRPPADHWCTEPFSTRQVRVEVSPGSIRLLDAAMPAGAGTQGEQR
jgi:hypothetical protein